MLISSREIRFEPLFYKHFTVMGFEIFFSFNGIILMKASLEINKLKRGAVSS